MTESFAKIQFSLDHEEVKKLVNSPNMPLVKTSDYYLQKVLKSQISGLRWFDFKMDEQSCSIAIDPQKSEINDSINRFRNYLEETYFN